MAKLFGRKGKVAEMATKARAAAGSTRAPKDRVRNPNAATPAVRGSRTGRATPAIPSKKR